MGKFKYVSLFSGIGGFDKPITDLGGELLLASEIDEHASKGFEALYGHKPEGDVTKIEAEDVPDHDLLVGGFPCQSFSYSGLRKGLNDTRGTLFFEVARIAKVKKPKVMLLENVKGLLSDDNGRTIELMVQVLNQIGYRVDFSIVNSKYFGVPQSRERVYIVAVREDLVENRGWYIRGNTLLPMTKRKILFNNRNLKTFNFPFPKGLETKLSIRDIMEDNVDEKYYVTKESALQLLEEIRNKEEAPVKEKARVKRTLFKKQGIDEGIKVVGILDRPGLETNNRVYETGGLAPTIMTRGECYVLEEDPRIKVVGRVHKGMSGVVYSADGVSPTITTNGECKVVESKEINVIGNISGLNQRGMIHDSEGIVGAICASDYKGAKAVVDNSAEEKRIRRLTPKEYLRLQAFPEGTYETLREVGISDSQIYKQAGNAVTLTVIDALVRQIIYEGYLD